MPTYHYRCETCRTSFDLVQSFSDDALKKCPTKSSGLTPSGCTSPGRGKVAKVFSAPGITFKGSGFYKTDSRTSSGNGSSEKKTDSSTKADSSAGSSSKTESTASTSSD